MIQITPHMRIFQYLEPVDFRKGIDGLGGICRSKMKQDPTSGAMFIFINRRRTALRVLVHDGGGFWLCHKRFSQGKIRFWPISDGTLTAPQLQVLLYNGNPLISQIPPDWKKISSS